MVSTAISTMIRLSSFNDWSNLNPIKWPLALSRSTSKRSLGKNILLPTPMLHGLKAALSYIRKCRRSYESPPLAMNIDFAFQTTIIAAPICGLLLQLGT